MISGLGEGVIWLIQSNLIGISPASIYIDVDGNDGTWEFFGGLAGTAAGALLGALGVAFTVGTGGLGFVLGAAAAVAGGAVGHAAGNWAGGAIEDMFSNDFYLPLYAISPAEIFSNLVPALDINFINPSSDAIQEITGEDGETRKIYNSAAILAPQISKWYVALRNLVLVGLMVVLLYIGIRIVISSTSGEKAKYKEHIKDWIIAVMIVVFMHYIMAFAISITQYITDMLNKSNEVVEFPLAEDTVNAVEEAAQVEIKPDSEGNYFYYTNLMGYARLMQQANLGYGQFSWNSIGYTIVFLVLVIYTVMFLIIYLKRVIYMAFLTMIAPLVALTYPIDKITDGQAQAFNMWIKEYIYNLLLQPFHLLLYTMLVGSVIDLAMNNMVYALVALGFLIPAEKLLRRFFGFDQKAPEAGSIVGGVVGGSMAMSAINNLRRIGSVGQRRNGGKPVSSGNNNGKARLVETNRKPEADKKQSIEELLNAPRTVEPTGRESVQTGNVAIADNIPTADNIPNGYGQTDSGIYIPRQGQALQMERATVSNDDTPNGYGQTDSGIYIPRQERALQIERQTNGNTSISPTQRTSITPPQAADNSNVKKKKISKAAAAGLTALHYTGKGLAEVGKRAPRLMTKAALGATLGTVGVAAGIATGDWSNIAAYGAAATGVGVSIGEGVSNVAGNIGSGTQNVARGIRSDYEARAYTKEERTARQNARADEEWRKNKDVIRMYKDAFGRDYRQAMDKALEYRKYGITDDKATIKSIESTGIDGEPSRQEIATTKISAAVKTEDELKETTDRLRKNGVSETTIRELEGNVRKRNISGGFV